MIQLTLLDRNRPPLSVNPHHVVSVTPRRVVRPNAASQSPDLIPSWEGSIVHLSTGSHHNVIEEHDQVLNMVAEALRQNPLPVSSVPEVNIEHFHTPPRSRVTGEVLEPQDETAIPQSQVSGLTEAIQEAEAIEQPAEPPAKKAPAAKKAPLRPPAKDPSDEQQ